MSFLQDVGNKIQQDLKRKNISSHAKFRIRELQIIILEKNRGLLGVTYTFSGNVTKTF